MTDRKNVLRDLAETVSDHEAVADAWLAKSFTDRLLVVDLWQDESLPAEVTELLASHDLVGANEVYGTDDTDRSFMGTVGETTRHRFVDVRSRGEHQSYVVE